MKKSLSKVYSAELDGIEARLIEVETDVHAGVHSFAIVGLADKALAESKERINAALKNVGVLPPSRQNGKVIVNLAPADVKKTGSQYDLAIAIGFLIASGQLTAFKTANYLFAGELALDGSLRPIAGAMSMARLAVARGIACLIVPSANAAEAALISGVTILPAENLGQIIAYLSGKKKITPQPPTVIAPLAFEGMSMLDIKGQQQAKRALMVAAAGGHNVLMVGPPGTGKTMLAQALLSLLPDPEISEIIEVTQIYSAAGLLSNEPYISTRPFRSPHQTSSPVSVVGGGTHPRPGEISLAHRGVLFLDEVPEFRRDLLEALRQPLESGHTIVTRVSGSVRFPARFTLVAAMNPCPCGYYGDPERACSCGAYEVNRYQKKVSGPLLDRIDLQISVPRVAVGELRAEHKADQNELLQMRQKVLRARQRQQQRLGGATVRLNSDMSSKETDKHVTLDQQGEEFIRSSAAKSLLSARGLYRVLKMAQTIADLDDRDVVTKRDVAEAFTYRLREQT